MESGMMKGKHRRLVGWMTSKSVRICVTYDQEVGRCSRMVLWRPFVAVMLRIPYRRNHRHREPSNWEGSRVHRWRDWFVSRVQVTRSSLTLLHLYWTIQKGIFRLVAVHRYHPLCYFLLIFDRQLPQVFNLGLLEVKVSVNQRSCL